MLIFCCFLFPSFVPFFLDFIPLLWCLFFFFSTAILALTNCRIPAENILGEEGKGFQILMSNLAQERLDIAIAAAAQARRVLALTVQHCHRRKGDFS